MPNVNFPSRGLGLITGSGVLLPSFGLGLGPVLVPAGGGAFYAEPDRHLRKEIIDLELSKRIIEDQITDQLKAKAHAKPAPVAKRPKQVVFNREAARQLQSDDVDRLLVDLKQVEAKIENLERDLAEIREEEDLVDLLLLQ